VEGVRVYVNGQEAGRTDARGRAVVPHLASYYDNQLSIDDGDIPIDFLVSRVRLNFAPALRSGNCVEFPLHPYRAQTGRLLQEKAGEREALAFVRGQWRFADEEYVFETDGDGYFYFDNSQEQKSPLGLDHACGKPPHPPAPRGSARQAMIIVEGKNYLIDLPGLESGQGLIDHGEVLAIPAPEFNGE
jgi:hypothetical protein